jgi:MFS family permease
MSAQTRAGSDASGFLGLFRNREYVGLMLANLISLVGDQLSRVALVVLVYERTNSPVLSSATYAASFLPVVIGSPLLGGLADRLPRRQVLIGADLIRAALFGLMALPGVPIWALITLLMVAVTVEAPYSAARGPLMREILADDENYQRGTSADEALWTTGQILGFVAAGALLVVFEPSTALLLDACTFVIGAAIIRTLVNHRPAADLTTAADANAAAAPGRVGLTERCAAGFRTGLSDARLGFRAAMSPGCRRPLLLTWVGLSLAIAPEAVAVPWAAEMGAGSTGVGMLLAAGPVGAVVGLALMGRFSVERGQKLLLPLTVMTLAPVLVVPVATQLWWAMALVFLTGVGGTYSMFARVAFVRAVPDAQRGRAFGVAASGLTAGQGVGIAFAGALASLTTPAWSIALCSGIGLALVTLVAVTSPAAEFMAEDADDDTFEQERGAAPTDTPNAAPSLLPLRPEPGQPAAVLVDAATTPV